MNNSITQQYTGTSRQIFISNNFIVFIIVTDVIGSLMASISNALIILMFVKISSLQTPSNILILSLAISDFGVGLLVQPAYCFVQFAQWTQNYVLGVTSYEVVHKTAPSMMNASLLTVATITIDRFLAVHLHLRYQELVTTKRSFIAVTVIWILSLSTF